MSSAVVTIADAIVAELNAGTFTPAIQAQRYYRPSFDLADLKTLRVSVVPKKIEVTPLGRSQNQNDVSIDIAVQKKLDSGDNAEIDPLMALVEQIADYFRLRKLASVAATWIRTENAPIYALEHLEQQRVFTSVLTLTFRTVR